MPRVNTVQEVAILKFFEEAPVEKAEMLFNIVRDKMRARRAQNAPAGTRKKEPRTPIPKENAQLVEPGTL